MIDTTIEGPLDWQQMRQQMPVAGEVAYFDHAAVSPLPAPTRQAIAQWLDQAAEQGTLIWHEWALNVERTRRRAASLFGADASEIALVPNTTSGIHLVAEGFPWREGDNLVTLADEFPSNLYPWINLASRGVETRRVPPPVGRQPLDDLFAACDSRTRLISVSWVSFCSGWRLDLEQLVQRAHEKEILVFLDAIQGLGVFPIDLHELEIDFLAADGHKWLLAPEGAGIFYLRQQHLDLLRPLVVGWNSVEHASQFDRIEWQPRATAVRYEGGSLNMAGLAGLSASLEFLQASGLGPSSDRIAQRVLEISDHACQQLASIGATVVSSRTGSERSGIVAFDLPGQDLEKIRRVCQEQKIALSCRNGLLRISPHAYVDKGDVERLIDVLRSPPS